MFMDCSSLESLDLSGFDTAGALTDSMFLSCDSLALLSLGSSFVMNGNEGLVEPPNNDDYTGEWACFCGGRASGLKTLSAAELMSGYDGASMAGQWTWMHRSRYEAEDQTFTYTGEGIRPKAKLIVGQSLDCNESGVVYYADAAHTQKLGESYSWDDDYPVDAGVYYMRFWAQYSYGISNLGPEDCWTDGPYGDCVLTIEPASISEATVKASDCVYDGTAKKPEVTVTWKGRTLEAGKDYAVSYTDNTAAGTAKVTVTGQGNFKDSAFGAFAISLPGKSASTVTLPDKSATYTGEAIAMGGAKVTGSTGKVTYAYYSDAACTKAVAAASVVNAGTYYVKAAVAADGSYAAATSKAAKLVIGKAASKVELPDKSATYTGKRVSMDGAKVAGSTGKVTYAYYSDAKCKRKLAASKVKAVGAYYVKATVAADANHRAATSAAARLTVNPRPTRLKSAKGYTVTDREHAGNKGLRLKWRKPKAECAGVEFRVQAYDKQAAEWRTVQSAKAAKRAYPKGCTVGKKSLKKRTEYRVQVRTYKKVSGEYYYSTWSNAKTARTPK